MENVALPLSFRGVPRDVRVRKANEMLDLVKLAPAAAAARHFPAIHWLTSYSEYLNDLSGWYSDHVSPKFVDYRNRLMAILNQESSLM